VNVMGLELVSPFACTKLSSLLRYFRDSCPQEDARIPSLYISSVSILRLTNLSVMFAHMYLMPSKLLNKGELSYVGCV
jgi:hypothetical protein